LQSSTINPPFLPISSAIGIAVVTSAPAELENRNFAAGVARQRKRDMHRVPDSH
jgi:hypothetical protein